MMKSLISSNLLEKGLEQLTKTTSKERQEKLLLHLKLLKKWGKIYNLTSILSEREMITKHILDSISINQHLQGNHFLDIGSGAGFPGIPLAIWDPARSFVLIESSKKKVQFLRHVVFELDLQNVTIINSRVEDFKPEEKYNGIICRALGSIDFILKITSHLRNQGVYLYIMLGKKPDKVNEKIGAHSYNLVQIDVPFLNADRNLLVVQF